jgi:hypothetical protein
MMLEIFNYIIPALIALVGNYYLNNYRINKLEEEIKSFKDISERLARIEGKLDYITNK